MMNCTMSDITKIVSIIMKVILKMQVLQTINALNHMVYLHVRGPALLEVTEPTGVKANLATD